jgi:hypothetical protein
MRSGSAPGQPASGGFALMFVLVLLLAATLASTALISSAQMARSREREADLFFVGQQYAVAIARYSRASPAGAPNYPRRLDELLEDNRFPMPVRHLRKLWRDPITDSKEWGLVKLGDRIVGVYSLSQRRVIRQKDLPSAVAVADENKSDLRYSDLHFLALNVAVNAATSQ